MTNGHFSRYATFARRHTFSLNDIAADETGVRGGDLDLVEKINTTIISGAARLTFSED